MILCQEKHYYIPFLASTLSGQAQTRKWLFELIQRSSRGLNLPHWSLPELMRRKDIKTKRIFTGNYQEQQTQSLNVYLLKEDIFLWSTRRLGWPRAPLTFPLLTGVQYYSRSCCLRCICSSFCVHPSSLLLLLLLILYNRLFTKSLLLLTLPFRDIGWHYNKWIVAIQKLCFFH